MQLRGVLIKLRYQIIHKQKEYEEQKINKMFQKEIKIKNDNVVEKPKKGRFYALFELELKSFGVNKNIEEKLGPLKFQYTNMMNQKLQEQYKEIDFFCNDGIFMVFNQFCDFDTLMESIKKIYRIFYDLDKKQVIETNFLFSFWYDCDSKGQNQILSILREINNLKNLNKILLNKEACENSALKYSQKYNFAPFGIVRLENFDNSEGVYNLELFCLNLSHKIN